MTDTAPMVQLIPVDQINVLNPRSRNKAIFQSIVSNISNIGLKKPITVARRSEPVDGKSYDLVCGQGRLEAFVALGQTDIPAIIKDASREECFLMSLVENVARRQIRPLELLREINNLKSRGYSTAEIAKKIDVTKSYVGGIVHLLRNGEERLLYAVEKGRIPLSVAMQIADTDEEGVQKALCQAYEEKLFVAANCLLFGVLSRCVKRVANVQTPVPGGRVNSFDQLKGWFVFIAKKQTGKNS